MNRLLTPNGGMPLHGDDLQFIQDAYKECFGGIVSAFSNASGNLILSGMEITVLNNTLSLTAGFVSIGNDIYYFPNQALTPVSTFSPLDDVYIVLDVAYDPDGNDEFADLVSRDTHQVRRAKIIKSIGSAPLLGITLDGARRMKDAINDYVEIPNISESIHVNGGIYYNGFGAYVEAKKNKRFDVVTLSGRITGGETNGNGAIKLPGGFRPSMELAIPVAMNVAPFIATAYIQPNGDIYFLSFPSVALGADEYICLNSIRFEV